MDTEGLTQSILKEHAETLRSRCEERVLEFSDYLEECESPIERLFLARVISEETPWFSVAGDDPDRRCLVYELDPLFKRKYHVQIVPQFQVASYRIDFLFKAQAAGYSPALKLAVELDGHDFHEKTKEQSQRDKSRDRELTKLGFRVVRFTGSEIYRTAASDAVTEIREIIFAALDQADKKSDFQQFVDDFYDHNIR